MVAVYLGFLQLSLSRHPGAPSPYVLVFIPDQELDEVST